MVKQQPSPAAGDLPDVTTSSASVPGAAAPVPEPVAERPFAVVSGWDYVRDVVAALLLLVSLGLRWDFGHEATDRIDVVLITILSVFSLAVPHLARLGTLGQGWTAPRIRLVRLLVNLPYVLMVVVYLGLDLAQGGGSAAGGGVGAAVGVGLAGALLAAQPRESELGRGREPGAGLWSSIVVVLGAVIAVGAVASLFLTLVRARDDLGVRDAVTGVLVLAGVLALVAWPVLGTALRDGSWRLVLLTLGGAAAVLLMLADGGRLGEVQVESVHHLGFGYVLWAAVAAVAAAPAVGRAMDDGAPGPRQIGAAVRLLTLTIVVCAIDAALTIVRLTGSHSRGALVFSLVFTVLYLMGALVVRSALVQRQPNARALAYGVAAALAFLGLVNLAVIGAERFMWAGYLDLLLALVIPVALAAMVSVPGSRQAAGSSRTGPVTSLPTTAQARSGPVTSLPPVAQPWQAVPFPGPAAPPPVMPLSVRLATDPRTPATTLAELAVSAPEARPYIARHPAAYPGLLAWLAAQGDPAVNQALRERGA